MITLKEKPNKASEIRKILHPIVEKWFFTKFKSFSPPQLFGLMEVHSRSNLLVSASTGSGKCITPDSTILVNIGGETKLLTGYELIELSNSGKLISNVGKSGKLVEVKKLDSYSIYNNKLKKTKALIYHENYKGEIYKIKTEYGREIRLNPDHPLLVEKENEDKWIPIKNIKEGEKIAVPIKLDLPEKEIFLDYDKAISNLRKNGDIVITYKDYLRLKKKTHNFKIFDKLNKKELYELKTLLKTSFNNLSQELDVNMTTIFRLFSKETDYHKEELFKLFKKKCKGIKFELNRIIVKNNGRQTYSFLYPKKVDVRLARWLAFVLAEGLIGDYRLGTHLAISQKNRKGLLGEVLKTTRDVFGLEFKKKNKIDYTINRTLFCYFLTDLLETKQGRGRYVPYSVFILYISPL